MRANEFINEAKLGTEPKRPSRKGDRPERGHTPVTRYRNEDMELDERGKAPRALCVGTKPDSELGASQLSSCKSQGLRARDGEKSHLVGSGNHKKRIKVGGKKIKGKKYGGPLPDYGTRKNQK
jgi:hypothetical protein